MYWPDLQLPPINLWNAPKQDKRMVVYIVYRVIRHEGWDLMKVFRHSPDAWLYKEHRDSLKEPEDVSYVVQTEEVL